MMLVDWVQSLLVSTAVGSHKRQEDQNREVLEERILAGLD